MINMEILVIPSERKKKCPLLCSNRIGIDEVVSMNMEL